MAIRIKTKITLPAKIKSLKTFTLDYSKWRSGQNGDYQVGQGPTELLNKKGYMCCLGQFCQQAGVPDKELLKTAQPANLEIKIPALTKGNNYTFDWFPFKDTQLANAAITINDNMYLTSVQRLKALKALFSKNGIKMRVINAPKEIMTEFKSRTKIAK